MIIKRVAAIAWFVTAFTALATEHLVTSLSPSALGGKTLWVDVTEKNGTAPYPVVGTAYQVVLTATGPTNGTFSVPAAPGMAARTGTWSAGLPGGMPQGPGNYLFINFVGLLGDAVVDNFTFYPAFGAPVQIPCAYYLYRGNVVFPIDAVDNQRGNVRVTDGEVPTPIAPSILAVTGGTSFFSGASPTLTANVSGTFPLAYQWLKNATPIPNATNASLPLPAIQVADAGAYTLTVTNVAGSASTNLTVTVTPSTPPVITTQPTNQVVFANQTVQLNVAATGTGPLSFQWRKEGVNLTTNAVTFGITNAQLTIYNLSATNEGDYSVVITNYAGSVTSAVANISILQVATPTFLTQPPVVVNVLTNAPFSITAVVTGTPTPTLQWQKNNVNLPGATNATLNRQDTNYNGGGNYRLIAANLNGSATSAVTVVSIYDSKLYTVNPAPTNATLAAGGTLRQLFKTYGLPPVNFTLRKDGTNVPGLISLPENVFTDLYSAQYSLTLTNLQPSDSGAYTYVASNTVGGVVTSAVFNVLIQATSAPVVLQPPTNVSVFLSTSGTIVNQRVTYSSFYPVTVQWLSNDVVLAGQTSSNLTLGYTGPQGFDLRAVLANQVGSTTSAVARINITYGPGTADTNFVSTNAIAGQVTSLAALPDGSVVAGGNFTMWGASNRNYLVTLATNGSVTPWLAHTNGLNGAVNALHRYGNGKLLVGGAFTNLGTSLRYSSLLRLNADGSLDETFLGGSPNATRYIDHTVTAFAVRTNDGAIGIIGSFTNVAGQVQPSVALLDADGVFQTGFRPVITNSPTQVNPARLFSLAFQADGRLLVGGYFGLVNGLGRTNLVRLNTNGTVDTSFNVLPVTFNAGVAGLAVQADGRICLAGDFTSVSGPAGTTSQSRNGFARVQADGTLDPVNPAVFLTGGALAVQPGGNVLVGGNQLARMLANGTFDTNFPGNGFGTPTSGAQVTSFAFAPDGSLWIGGSFSTVGGRTQWRVARLSLDTPMPVVAPNLGQILFSAGNFRFRLPTVTQRGYRVEMKNSLNDATWQLHQNFTGDGQEREITVTLPANTPRAFFRIAAD